MSRRFWCLAGLAGMALMITTLHVHAASEGRACGGPAGISCNRGLWCEPRPGTCRVQRARGICVKVPQVCTMIFQPVCGCDGRTYSNDCARRAARVGKRHDGQC